MIVQTRAPGKLMLLGEYAVLEGHPAMVMAVDRFARVHFESSGSPDWLFSSPQLQLEKVPLQQNEAGALQPAGASHEQGANLTLVLQALNTVLQTDQAPLPPAHIVADTADFYLAPSGFKLGLGSSAALTVALVAGAQVWKTGKARLVQEEVFRQAFLAHRKAQQNLGSGADVAASTLGRSIWFQPNPTAWPTIQPLPWPQNRLGFCAVWSGEPASTQEMVLQMRAFARKEPRQYQNMMNQLGETTRNACLALRQNEMEGFLQAVKHFYELLIHLTEISGVPIVSSVHRRIGEMVYRSGGVYKPSGAGKGDLGVVFAPTSVQLDQIVEKLKRAGFGIIFLQPAQQGVQVTKFED